MNMTPRSPARRLVLLTLALILSATAAAVAQRKVASISSGWVKLPAAGATQAEAFLVIDNPTAYDVSLQKPSSDTAGVVEIREAGKPAALDFLSVAAYGGLEMGEIGRASCRERDSRCEGVAWYMRYLCVGRLVV